MDCQWNAAISAKTRIIASAKPASFLGVCYANTNVSVVAGGAFSVTVPNATGVTWYNGSYETVTWDVGLTNTTPIFCDTVRILISLDGGTTYSVLKNSTPNDGIETVSSPTVASTITTCRLKVEAKGNIFYDISSNNFTISSSPAAGIKVNSLNQVGLSAFPNPFNTQLTIIAGNLNSIYPTTIKITDVLGKLIENAPLWPRQVFFCEEQFGFSKMLHSNND